MGTVGKVLLWWSGWCLLHSLLITPAWTDWLRSRWGRWFAAYRFGFVMVSAASLGWVLRLQAGLEQRPLFSWSGPWWLLRLGLLAYGLVMFVGGARAYDLGYFLGIRQVVRLWRGREEERLPFRWEGMLTVVRHPWYSGGLALLWAWDGITDVTLAGKLVLSGYLVAGAFLEERKLVREFGRRYLAYQRLVPPAHSPLSFGPSESASSRHTRSCQASICCW